MNFTTKICAALAVVLAGFTGQQTAAQNLFAPVVQVNDAVVTEYEIQQRQRFLQLLNAPGADRESVITSLIEDRLRVETLVQAGVPLEGSGLRAGMEEFASRANLSADEFIKALGQSGVSEESFRDFVKVSIAWRELIRGRYNNRVQITEAEIDKALGTSREGSGLRVLLSEIIIPAPPQNAARVAALADQISQTRSEAEFSAFARKYSATASRGNGGRLPWTPLEELPTSLHPMILALGVGEVSQPLPIPNAIALFQLRGIEETGKPSQSYSAIDYAAYYLPGGRSEAALAAAAKLRGKVDTCDDLYGIAKGQPKEVLDRGTKAPAEIPQDIALELSKLDPGEVSTALTRSNGQTLVFLMLCKRTASANADVSRDAVVAQLRQRQLEGYSQLLIDQLRADARINRL